MPFNLHRLISNRLPLLPAGKLRIAQLTPGNGLQSAEMFPVSRWRELSAFAPEILAGSATDLQRLMERLDMGTLKVDSISHFVWVLTDLGDRPLTGALRAMLWERFGTPIYEALTDGAGSVLAYECENHDGLHVTNGARFAVVAGELVLQTISGAAQRTGLTRKLDSTACPCGRAGVRIVKSTGVTAVADEEPLLAAIA